jgi:hypothetical protein
LAAAVDLEDLAAATAVAAGHREVGKQDLGIW